MSLVAGEPTSREGPVRGPILANSTRPIRCAYPDRRGRPCQPGRPEDLTREIYRQLRRATHPSRSSPRSPAPTRAASPGTARGCRRPGRHAAVLVTQMRALWDAVLAPWWLRISALLESEIASRARRLVAVGDQAARRPSPTCTPPCPGTAAIWSSTRPVSRPPTSAQQGPAGRLRPHRHRRLPPRPALTCSRRVGLGRLAALSRPWRTRWS
jgi:hypothetical protein